MKNAIAKITIIGAGLVLASSAMADSLFSLKNLERQRAAMLATATDSQLNVQQRQLKQQGLYRRLVDVERMVMRDERLPNNSDMLVKKAFNNYDLTFLVHASAENNAQPFAHWLDQLGFAQTDIQAGKVGRR